MPTFSKLIIGRPLWLAHIKRSKLTTALTLIFEHKPPVNLVTLLHFRTINTANYIGDAVFPCLFNFAGKLLFIDIGKHCYCRFFENIGTQSASYRSIGKCYRSR